MVFNKYIFCKIFMKTYFKEHLQTAASADNATNSK